MKKLMTLAGSALAVAGSAFAEGGSSGLPSAELLKTYIDTGKSEILTLFTAGAAIVGAFFVWALIKRALRASK